MDQKRNERCYYKTGQYNGCRYIRSENPNVPEKWSPPEGSEIFVGNLPPDCKEQELFNLFKQHGPIFEVRILVNFHGNNRGFAFVRYFDPETAEKAITRMKDHLIRKYCRLLVSKSTDHRTLVLAGLAAGISSYEVEAYFRARSQDQLERVIDLKTTRPSFLIQFSSHGVAAVIKRSCSRDALPHHWGTHAILIWQPNQEVENRIKTKKKRDMMRNIIRESEEACSEQKRQEELCKPPSKTAYAFHTTPFYNKSRTSYKETSWESGVLTNLPVSSNQVITPSSTDGGASGISFRINTPPEIVENAPTLQNNYLHFYNRAYTYGRENWESGCLVNLPASSNQVITPSPIDEASGISFCNYTSPEMVENAPALGNSYYACEPNISQSTIPSYRPILGRENTAKKSMFRF